MCSATPHTSEIQHSQLAVFGQVWETQSALPARHRGEACVAESHGAGADTLKQKSAFQEVMFQEHVTSVFASEKEMVRQVSSPMSLCQLLC